jgi:hypothetical protein
MVHLQMEQTVQRIVELLVMELVLYLVELETVVLVVPV